MALVESFRAVRWVRTLNLVLQAVLFLTFFGGLNYVAKNHPSRFDLTAQRKFSLSPESLSYIKNLQRPVHLVMTTSSDVENAEVKGLIDEYVYATEDRPAGRITKETLDVYQNRKRAEELGLDQAGLIVLLSGDRRRVVTLDELYTLKNKKRDMFNGEQTLSAAILDVVSTTRQKIYFLTGHSERKPSDTEATRGLSGLRDQLKLRNFAIDEVNLTVTRKVPADASLLFAVAPQSAYSRAEQELLRQYLGANAGRMILMLSAGNGMSTTDLGLDDLLLDWGVLVHNDVILDSGPQNVTDNLDLLIWAYAPNHPITKTLIDAGQQLRLGRARTVMPDPG
ncbi:MAG: GldG family protein, partial [Opitutaceae bacterium]